MRASKRIAANSQGTPPKKAPARKSKSDAFDFNSFESEYEVKHILNTLQGEIPFIQSQGHNQQVLQQQKLIQDTNTEVGFIPEPVDDIKLADAVAENVHKLFTVSHYNNFNDIQLSSLDLITFYTMVNLDKSLEFQFNRHKSSILNSNNILQFPYDEANLRNGIVFNTGGTPLTMEWCPLKINATKYLFVCVVDDDTNLTEFSNKDSCLMILEYNETERKFSLNKNIVVNSVIKEIEFSYVSSPDTSLLKLTLSNGTVEIWKINPQFLNNDNDNKYFKYKSNAEIFQVPNELIKITTSSFITPNTLLFGTNRGFIGQFTIENHKLDYLVSTKLPAITCIKNTWPTSMESNSITAFVSSTDFMNYLMRVPLPNNKSCLINNIKIVELLNTNRELQFNRNTIYLNNGNAFLTVDWPYVIKRVTIDNPNSASKFRISNDKEINCLNCQINYKNGLLNNGFVLITGHTNGSIRLSNYLNLNSILERKLTTSTIKIMQLNKSNLADNKYWLDLSYEVSKTGEPPNIKGKIKQPSLSRPRNIRDVPPKSICPLKVSMMNNSIASIWNNGLIILEDLVI